MSDVHNNAMSSNLNVNVLNNDPRMIKFDNERFLEICNDKLKNIREKCSAYTSDNALFVTLKHIFHDNGSFYDMITHFIDTCKRSNPKIPDPEIRTSPCNGLTDFVLVNNKGGGDCLYLAAAMCLFGYNNDYKLMIGLRVACIATVLQHWQFFVKSCELNLIEDPENANDTVRTMKELLLSFATVNT